MPPEAPISHFDRFGNLHTLILDADARASQMTRRVISTLGINKTMLARDAEEAVSLLEEKSIDLLMTEWDIRGGSGIALAQSIRQGKTPVDPTLPIIMITARSSAEELKQAIDSGVHEVITKPFSPRILTDKLLAVIDAPRAFIYTESYAGPDRRRQSAPVEQERRDASQPPLSITREELALPFPDGRPRLLAPDFSLKKKLEAVPAAMAGLETLLSRDQAANKEEDYLQWILKDITALKQSHKSMVAQPDYAGNYVERISSAALSIRTRALTAGYILGAKVAAHLNDFCRKYFRRENRSHAIVIEKHIETLSAIFNARMTGDGGNIGKELFDELVQLVKKYY